MPINRRKKDSFWCCLTVTYGTLGILLLYGALWQLQYVGNDGTMLGKSCCLPERCDRIPSTFTVKENSIFCDLTEKDAVAFDTGDIGIKSCKEDLLCIREEQKEREEEKEKPEYKKKDKEEKREEDQKYDTGNCGQYDRGDFISQKITIAASMYLAGIAIIVVFHNVLIKYVVKFDIWDYELCWVLILNSIVWATIATIVATIVTMARGGAWSKLDIFPATKTVFKPSNDPNDSDETIQNVELCDVKVNVIYYKEAPPDGPPSLLLILTVVALIITRRCDDFCCCCYEEDEPQGGNRSLGPDAEEDCKKKDDDGVAELLKSGNRSEGPDTEEDRNANCIQLELGNMKE